jgi:dihydroxyacetone kinase
MTRLFNDPADFADELVEGFVAANSRWVVPVAGGVVRAAVSPSPTVAVVVGGGSGHYPAFGGLVGQGLAHGAAMGNLFASPSAQQVYSVAKAAHQGKGVLLTFGNYAGDVLHFGQAQEWLRADGIECETVTVTDDISSASADEAHKRRGIAGDLAVFKAASAAAEAGLPLAEVVEVARRANERTRSFGVAFGGCTLPGAAEPLFTVPEGRMALGLGIHGEPGIGETDIPTADGLAGIFVDALLAELPGSVGAAEGQRAAVILNGLGSVKYEELFVVYRRVAQLLAAAGVEIVEPEVGELVTSFDMAGASLTLFWLDEELERFWSDPADAPAYRKGSVAEGERRSAADVAELVDEPLPEAGDASRAAAVTVTAALAAVKRLLDERADELGRIDAVAGDGDHGIGMQRGSTAAALAAGDLLERGAGAGSLLARAGDAWANKAGGTSGALWGAILRAVGETIGDTESPDARSVAAGVAAANTEVMRFGKAQPGDKTMVDALVPFSETLDRETAAGARLADAWVAASAAADAAAKATADLLPRVGRARPHAEKSLGTPDAGATSLAYIAAVIGTVLSGADENPGGTPAPGTPSTGTPTTDTPTPDTDNQETAS